jgi:hypothetical protein
MNLLKLVKLQNLVTKCCTENIALRSLHILYMFILRAEIVTIFQPKMVTISARNTNIYKIWKLCKAIFSKLYNISQPNFAILLISLCSF